MDRYAGRRGSVPSIGTPLSLEASLDEENKEVLATLSRQRSAETPRRVTRNESPLPSIRSMLDVDSPPQPRHGSIAGIGVGVTSPRDQRRPSKRLDPSDPSTWTKPHRATSPTASPVTPKNPVEVPRMGLPKINFDDRDIEQRYNFDMASMPTSTGAAVKGSQNKTSIYSAATLDHDTSSSYVGTRSPSIAVSPPGTTSIYLQSSPAGGIPLKLTPEASHIKSPMSTGISSIPNRRMSEKSSSFSDMSEEPTGRVQKDEDGDEDALADSSDEEEDARSSSSDDEGSPDDARGRTREKVGKDEVEEKIEEKEEEDATAPQSKGVRSLLDPITSPSRPADRKAEIHPPSSFGRSGPTAADFEDDEDADIQKAKTLGVHVSAVDNSIPDRNVRMIIRGEWATLQEEAENSNRDTKLYLTCTDMSTEASYALEWTVGTMLRDGDTLLAIYAIEDENAPKESEGNAVVMAESAKAATEAGDTMAKLTRQATDLSNEPSKNKSKFLPVTEALTSARSVDARNVSKKEMERLRAMDEIMEKFLKLVRKTPLQIRCMIEVIHCKSPKHLILNAIDELDPTLCVVGTRGRSSLKGVLLGSFSNYLVTKSSVPVMVARKRLKKPRHAKVNSTSIRLSNNLRAPALQRPRRGLENARID